MPPVARITQNYPGAELQYIGEKSGNPAPIDTRTKPIRVEYFGDSELHATISNFQPVDGKVGAYTCNVETLEPTLAFEADIVADPDMTPDGESELRVRVSFPILPEQAGSANFGLGAGVDK